MVLRRNENETESEYYLVERDNKKAIFHKSGIQVSDWFDWISLSGLIKGQSPYYIARSDDKYAIFDENGKRISGWFNYIYPFGLVRGESDYYVARENWNCAVYHKNGLIASDYFSYERISDTKYIIFNQLFDLFGVAEFFDEHGNIIDIVTYSEPPDRREEIIDYTKLLNI